MAELKRIDGELPTDYLASYGIPPKQPDEPKLKPSTKDRTEGELHEEKGKI